MVVHPTTRRRRVILIWCYTLLLVPGSVVNGYVWPTTRSRVATTGRRAFSLVRRPLAPTTARRRLRHWGVSSGLSRALLHAAAAEHGGAEEEEEEEKKNGFNSVFVAKTGGPGARSTSQEAMEKEWSLGAPRERPTGGHYMTRGGVQVTAHVTPLLYQPYLGGAAASSPTDTSAQELHQLIAALDARKGVLLTSSYEFPGRYSRWSLGFVNPPLQIVGSGRLCTITALNERGRVLLPALEQRFQQEVQRKGGGGVVEALVSRNDALEITVCGSLGFFPEEERSRQPSLFSIVRILVDFFSYSDGDGQLGLYGAFGYDLTFQFEPISLSSPRDPQTQRDLVLYLPDEILVIDEVKQDAWTLHYEFGFAGGGGGAGGGATTTSGLPRTGSVQDFVAATDSSSLSETRRDMPPSEFANAVRRAKEEFRVGNLFEVVLSQTFGKRLSPTNKPSHIFARLRQRNPSPYGFFLNLGANEYLVGASPEMFVRCEFAHGEIRVETCPISGTVARGVDALEDAKRVKSLMMNAKEESELTMCTDVDRNDKSRICVPGSVKVIGRRQIEMYSRLIHTVDHVEGYLREGFDALDAFLCHTWAVTVTGAPKTWAIQFVEDNEQSPRHWYGGAVGIVGFDGTLNTGLTLRTVRIKNGIAEVRAGATLLYDSDPEAEELETELKASAMLDAIEQHDGDKDASRMDPTTETTTTTTTTTATKNVGEGKLVILIDHQDSFVHTLGNYLRQTGAKVVTLRSGPTALATLQEMMNQGQKPDMVVLSPGPGNPSDFQLSKTLAFVTQHNLPAFGVCLGLQGMVEHFGGELAVLGYPMHGKPSTVTLTAAGKSQDSIFAGLPESFEVARYHSLYGNQLPDCLEVTATSEDGIVMGIRHKDLPFAAVQFHPESILTSPANGLAIMRNVMTVLTHPVVEEEEETTTPAIVAPLEN